MATIATEDPGMTLDDLRERFGPIPIRRIRQDPAPGTATEDDLIAIMGREDRLYELVDGVLVEKTMGWLESELTVRLILSIGTFAYQHRLGIVLGADGLMRLAPGLVRIPDIAFISWGRLNHVRPPNVAIAPFGPDLAVEVLSPSNTRKEMADKLADYFAADARLVWYVDPKTETVAVHESPDRSTVLRPGDRLDGGDVLPGFALPVADVFALPEPPRAAV